MDRPKNEHCCWNQIASKLKNCGFKFKELFQECGSKGRNSVNDANSALDSDIRDLNQMVSDLTREEGEVREQLEWMKSRGRKHKRQVDIWLNKLQDLKDRATFFNIFPDPYGWEFLELMEDLYSHKEEKPLVLSNELVGECFEKNVKKMWRLVEDEQVFIIGINGMGGVGKTFLATYMENEIKRKSTFKDVFWITVSHYFTIFKLQHDIAEKIGVKLNINDERTRATILSMALETREKVVLILDDVWKYIDLEKVGIPLRVNGIKLIITTRLRHVCRQMDCLPRNTITILPFSRKEEEEAIQDLFLLKLEHHGAILPPWVLEFARLVAMRCYGLPLGLSVMARTVKGRNDIWCLHAFYNLEKLEMGEEVKEEVLAVLKRSYDNLIEKDVQKCFLYCALLPNYLEKYLNIKLVEGGILDGNLKEIICEGHMIVDKLIDHSLLLKHQDGHIGMHGLVRNMACHILNECQNKVMVKCNENLRKLPDVKEWTIDLEVVSLAGKLIEEIQEGTSPNCPHLSTFILSDNSITRIPECFFIHMNALTLLDLSFSHLLKCLPNSLSDLRCLVSLVLSGCSKLEYIPPLGELQALSRLDISLCPSLLKVPQGLENLTNLKWLDMFQNVISTLIQLPESVLAGLINMQYLDLRGCSAINIEDVLGMTMLECFAGSFVDSHNYNRYVREILDTTSGPQYYFIHFGYFKKQTLSIRQYPIYVEFYHRRVSFGDCGDEFPYFLWKDLAQLLLNGNNQWECLCSALSSNSSLSLRDIIIHDCTKLKTLFCASCSLCTNIQNLNSLRLEYLSSLTVICQEHVVTDLTQSLSLRVRGVFSHLKEFLITGCHAIETLLKPGLVSQLGNLEFITVRDCKSIKEIFAVSYSSDDDASINITLPKLTKLKLRVLPQLKTVCKGILVCRSENILDINGCPNIEEHHRIRCV